jgi:phenylalanyl-tRNA synthetase beta chain
MKVPVKWLRELVPTDLPTAEIARRLTLAGLEAESIERIGDDWENVFIGVVTGVEPHPDADRLVLATVEAGEHCLTVVTGAPNIAAGQKVALALAGARLIDPYADEKKYKTLKPGAIRGVRSEGMVCSEKELGLSEEHEGILVLEPDAPAGLSLREWLGDEVIEFEITPNLVHAFSVLGIARELAAVLDLPVTNPLVANLSALPDCSSQINIEEPELCGRFTLTVIENVTVQPSPAWLQRRLRAAGLRPINTIVDLSNYVMLEVGHPNHAFDADKIAGQRLSPRRARANERLTTIDHVERELVPDTLVIADDEQAVAIAGIMGGADSEVTEATTRILLEAAWFNPASIRATSRAIKLRTDASARFERNIDPNGASLAAARFVQLLGEIDPGARPVGYGDVYLQRRDSADLAMPYSEIQRLLGMTIPLDQAVGILQRLSFDPFVENADRPPLIRVKVPTWRNDVNLTADLVEEVARIYGYDALPETLPSGTTPRVQRSAARLVDQIAQDALVEAGLFQVQTYTMINEADLRALSVDGATVPDVLGGYPRPEYGYVRAVNPLRSDWELMRPTMLPSLLKIVAENLKFSPRAAIFETARTYQPAGLDELPDERRAVSIAMAGARDPHDLYHGQSEGLDFFDVKGAVEVLLDRLGGEQAHYLLVEHPSLHPRRAAAIELEGIQIGVLGELHPSVAGHFGIETRVAVAEIDLECFARTLFQSWNVRPVSRFQPTIQDFAIVVPATTPAGDVMQAVRQATEPLLSDIQIFDVYTGPGIPDQHKSLAFRVTLSAPNRHLEDRELEQIRKRISQSVERHVGGTLRT